MLFGLANAFATFQSYINKYLAEKLDIIYIVYLDEIFIYTSKKGAKHEEAVRWLLGQVRKFGLYTSLKKYWFITDEIHFLGYIVSHSRVHIKPKRIKSIKNWPEPQYIRKIQVFINFANFYQQFIRKFDAIARPFTLMLKTDLGSKSSKPAKKGIISLFQFKTPLFLTLEAKKSFQKLKKGFCKELILQHFDIFMFIKLEIDASEKAIERVLCQQNIDKN